MLEIEAKFPLPDPAVVEEALHDLGAVATGERREEDHYFNAPDRDFATTDEAFRIRRVGDASRLTYKGPKIDHDTKSRTEIEAPLADGAQAFEAAAAIFRHLGYRPVAVVVKQRRTFHLRRGRFDIECCFDAVEEVGSYFELEIVADKADLSEAKGVLLTTAGELGFIQQERQSYLKLLLINRGE